MIEKGTRHSELLGRFGERVICNWLSRSGFEVCVADHTGLDIIAYKRGRRLGITVKSRTRGEKAKSESVNVFSRKHGDRKKLEDACEAFSCERWIGIYVECEETADLYLTSLAHYDSKYRSMKANAIEAWSMAKVRKNEYAKDPGVFHIGFKLAEENWPPVR